MFSHYRLSICVVICLFFVPLTVHAKQTEFSPVRKIQAEYNVQENTVDVSWKRSKGAKKYVVVLLQKKEVVKKIITKKLRHAFDGTLFTHEQKYQIRVRAKKTAQRTASQWKKARYTHEFPAPTITQQIDTLGLNSSMWLYAIDDGEDQVVLSSESSQSIRVARYDLSNPDTQPNWQTLITSQDVGSDLGIADHWHIYAHGYHWIVFSLSSATTSYLIQFDKEFNILKTVQVADNIPVTTDAGESFLGTNDMFLTQESDGVAVGHFYPSYGHRVFRFSKDAELINTVDVGGGENNHANGSSAYFVNDELRLFTSDTLNFVQYSEMRMLEFDTDWELQNDIVLRAEEETNFSMPSAAYLDNGYFVVHARMHTGTYAEGEMPPPGDGTTNAPDGGAIVRFVYAPDNTMLSKEIIAEEDTVSNRPHTILMDGNMLVTTWDSEDGGVSMRVDEVSFD